MKNLLLQFTETADQECLVTNLITYDDSLHLNVVNGTKIPAVNYLSESTETFTKSDGEGSDSDRDMLKGIHSLTDTSTETRRFGESSDSDRDIYTTFKMINTQTLTETQETTDSDK
jgi:hypothetical protein